MYIPRTKKIIKNLVLQRSNENTYEPTGSQTDIPGSQITYTPESGADKVVYEYSIQIRNDPDTVNYLFLELFQNTSGTWTSLGNGFRIEELAVYSREQTLLTAKFVMNAWSGSRQFKMRASALNQSIFPESTLDRSATFHQDDHGQKNDPIVKMYSIM